MIDTIMSFSVLVLFVFSILSITLIIGFIFLIKKLSKTNVEMKENEFVQVDETEKTDKLV